jgi:glyoxalase family protein
MSLPVSGLHHVTAIATDPQRNLDFYAGTLGLRLVKRTVNFDDPGTYHLYYGDRIGRPGTLITFFPWPGARPGRVGVGQAIVTGFRVPAGAIEFWEDRLGRAAVSGVTRRERFGEISLRFSDPDGLGLELVASGPAGESVWDGPVPAAMQIQSLHGSILHLQSTEDTIGVLTQALGMMPDGDDGVMSRFRPADPAGAGVLDLIRDVSGTNGELGGGSVHHIAWRARDGRHQLELRDALVATGVSATPVIDRQYFRSIYFREPGGVLFEIATDGPGFLIDEAEPALGQALRLPPQYEGSRAAIESTLPRIRMPAASGSARLG